MISKLHPGEVIDIVITFALGVEVGARVIGKVELLFVELHAGELLLGSIFSHQFEENGTVAMEDLVGFPNSFGRSTSKPDMIIIFAVDGAENFIGSPGNGVFANRAGAWHGWSDLIG